MTFGEKLQSLRQKAGMSQDALAEKLNVSRQAVSRWERDETMPETEKVVALADLFGVTTDYLLRAEQARQEKQQAERSVPPQRDWMDKLGYLAKTKGYLLGWVLIAWGVLDLAGILLMGLGVLSFGFIR
ncbi:helix-turn-helix domain-containing protein [uncultured Dysosmobacter sp.]|uniref:helix-turn-helix domain-containing protein n=1 Tax=uncultured Dysosmobacter sp. TaxID=2591384 RepID=UPI00260B7279|nr:helix-turn-helix domain-containing protein [uncultured Dysosmobacter sp.]